MKKLLQKTALMLMLVMFWGSVWGQVISQYVDTDSGTKPKGIEIWNNTVSSLDFVTNNLVIEKGINGGPLSVDYTLSSGILAAGDVIVIGSDNMETTAINNGATFYVKAFTFNGDDALVVKYGGTTTDIFGTPGVDPGNAWTGNGVSTADQNISLLIGINSGNIVGWTDPSIRFETFSKHPSESGGLVGFGLPPGTAGFWKPNTTTTNWETSSNWDDGNIPTSETNVTIPTGASNYPTISSNAFCKNITIEDGASLIGAEHLTVSGTATFQRSISGWTNNTPGTADGWHLLSSPVNNMTISGSDFVPGTSDPNLDDLYIYDEITNYWLNYKQNEFTNFTNGKGYLASYQTTATKDFTGTFNDTDITFTNLSKTADKGNGWHLLGNPFQSAIHWTNNVSTWNPTGIGTGAKIMNSGGTYTDITSDGANQYIPANQGFFVQALDASNSITIPLDERAHNTTSFYKSTVQNLLSLKVSDGEFYVESWIQIMDGATEDFDQEFDVNFLGGMYQAPYLFSEISNNQELSTNRIAPVTQHTTVQLGFKSFLDREYTISTDNAESFGDEIDVMLEDTQENIKINLKETPEYRFMATADELTERFIVHFFNVTGVSETNQLDGIQIYSYNNRIYLHSELNAFADVIVYNMLGQKVHQTPVELNGLQSFDLNQNTGWYVVQIVTEQGVKSEKVFIN